MDGLCGGITLILAVAYGILFLIKEMPMYAVMSFAIAGAVLGFLKYNFSPASIFLGDAGSLFFGYSLACLSIVHINTGISMSITGALGPIIILAYPVFDLTFVSISRLKEGRKLYIGGKDHSSHKLNVLGMTKSGAVYIILLINIILVSLGISLSRFERSPLLTLFLVIIALILSFFGAHLYKNYIFLKHKVALVLFDLMSINMAFLIYFYIKSAIGNNAPDAMSVDHLLIALAWINAFWVVLYAVLGLYDISFESRFRYQLYLLTAAMFVGLGLFLLANYSPENGMQISLNAIGLFLGILIVLNTVFRKMIFSVLSGRYFGDRKKIKAIVVVPDGSAADGDSLSEFNAIYDIVGYIGNGQYEGLEKVGEFEDITNILHERKITRVIIDYGENNYNDISSLFNSAYYMETLFLVTDRSADNKSGFLITPTIFDQIYIISIKHRKLFSSLIKRLWDFSLAVAVILLTFPFSIYKYLIDRQSGKDPISEKQIVTVGEREGKIKTDRKSAQSSSVRSWWALLSVLKGDISFYGTTITTMQDYKSNLNAIPGYWRKFMAKPGLFGPGYAGKSPRERFELDLAYMEKTSMLGDFVMIVKQMLGVPPTKIKELKHA